MVRGSWYKVTSSGGQKAYKVALNFNRNYVNNAYGNEANASTGWGEKGHSFGELLGSDGATVSFYNGNPHRGGTEVVSAKFDYIGVLPGKSGTHPSHFAALWPPGTGDKNDSKNAEGRLQCVLDTDSSLERNLRNCAQYHTASSPLVSRDKKGGANSAMRRCAAWEHNVIYYVYLDPACFPNFQGGAVMEDVHASPNAGLDGFEDVSWERCIY
jgi:hypothetical protein